ncbi:MAG: anhydro-N-acetylmuramic acid kinase [Bacteroidales bacterium]|nr:anhydro-N-acetylmuramic acid kinase [Bacteroidales bacterium]
MESYKVIGLMSGTSLDGVDIAYCQFFFDNKWKYEIIEAKTIEYSEKWIERLKNLHETNAETLALTHVEYGHYLGQITKDFIDRHDLSPDFISSHGHTVFHQPEKHFTLQIGDGSAISSESGFPVVFDFRSKDVALGGQGAPLVPIGDKLLFSEYEFCLNLGGIANISFEHEGQRIAFDICPVNLVLNYLANQAGEKFDKNGILASQGNINERLLQELNSLPFYIRKPPKSLGKEWVVAQILPLIKKCNINIKDKLRTYSEHIAMQISRAIKYYSNGKNFITGGGARNVFLINRIKANSKHIVIIPDNRLIDYKEALIFAFLGVLRKRNEVNCLSSVTGARRDSSSGQIVTVK